jgi:hypothetical protein
VLNDRIRLGLTILVGAGWLFDLTAPAYIPGYERNLAANGPLLLVLGSLFATRKKTKDDGDSE